MRPVKPEDAVSLVRSDNMRACNHLDRARLLGRAARNEGMNNQSKESVALERRLEDDANSYCLDNLQRVPMCKNIFRLGVHKAWYELPETGRSSLLP